MSRSKKGSKPPGYEFWSRRPSSCNGGSGRWAKYFTHKKERMQSKEIIIDEMKHYHRE